MDEPDYEGAQSYALTKLKTELPETLYYHSVWHTRSEVAAAVTWLTAREDVPFEERSLVRTAAFYHDIGFVWQRVNHEAIGAQIAGQVLPEYGFDDEQVRRIQGMIMATRLPQSPKNLLEQIVADADLDVLGRKDFWARNQLLRDELAVSGVTSIDVAWYGSQLRFLQNHRYFTNAARERRSAQKEENIAAMADLLRSLRSWNRQGLTGCPYPALLC